MLIHNRLLWVLAGAVIMHAAIRITAEILVWLEARRARKRREQVDE